VLKGSDAINIPLSYNVFMQKQKRHRSAL